MFTLTNRAALLAALLLIVASASPGATITFGSNSTLNDPGEYGRYGSDETNHPLLFTSGPDLGIPGLTWVALADPATDVSMFDTIGVPAGFVTDVTGGWFTVYARNSANIYWDGALLASTFVFGEYSAQTVGLTAAQLTPGLHLLRVEANASDLMPKAAWYGEFMGIQGPTTSPVPEPSTAGLIGAGFIAVGLLRNRMFGKRAP